MSGDFQAVIAGLDSRGSMAGQGPALKTGVPTILQVVPSLVTGGVERGACDVARAIEAVGLNAVVMSAGGPMAEDLVAAGVRHVTAPVATKSPLAIRRNIRRVAAVAEACGAAIIHARSRAPAWSAYYAARRLGLPFVTTFHGTYNFKGRAKRWYNSVMTRGDRVIAISQFIADHIAANYRCPADRVRVIHRGIDTDVFDPEAVSLNRIAELRNAWSFENSGPVILLPGRMARWKGHAVLIRAMTALDDPEVTCLIVGGGGSDSYVAELEAEVNALQLTDQVWFVGDCRDMPAAYALADLVVSASTDPEAFGRVAVEGQAMGKPVIASAHGGAQETVIDLEAQPEDGTGWLTPPGDAEALAAALGHALVLNATDRTAIGERGRANAIARFSRATMCRATLAVYAELDTAVARMVDTAA